MPRKLNWPERIRRRPHLMCPEIALAVASAVLGLLTAVIVFANDGNALNPRHGLEGTLPLLRTTQPGTERAQVQQATNAWLRSGSWRTRHGRLASC